MQQADVMVKRSNASGCGNVVAVSRTPGIGRSRDARPDDHPGKVAGAIKKREFAD